MGTFFNVLSEQNITEHFFGVERSVLTEHLDPVFPRTLHLILMKYRTGLHAQFADQWASNATMQRLH